MLIHTKRLSPTIHERKSHDPNSRDARRKKVGRGLAENEILETVGVLFE
jgi:hypothetical protein